jgi:hypothetical protein
MLAPVRPFLSPYPCTVARAAQHLTLNMSLTSAQGRTLYRGRFSRDECAAAVEEQRRRLGLDVATATSSSARARRPTDDRGVSPHLLSGAAGPTPVHARQLLKRRETWLDTVGHHHTIYRSKDGEAARWAGTEPAAYDAEPLDGGEPTPTRCSLSVPTRGSTVYVDGTCDTSDLGVVTLAHDVLRAEVGETFALHADDFPLALEIGGLRSSVRGDDAHDAMADDADAPAVYVTLFTEEVDEAARHALWVGVPLLYLALSCCCCCALCASSSGKEERRLEHLTELATIEPSSQPHVT